MLLQNNNSVIDITNKRFVVIGLQGSGKTWLVKSILQDVDRHIVYDALGEYRGFRRYVPIDIHSDEELDEFIKDTVIPYQPDLFVLDESSRYIDGHGASKLRTSLADLVDLSRHWGISWGCVARRPSQMHSHILELAHFVFIFGLHGRNDRLTLNNWYSGLGDVVNELPEYHFAVLEEGRRLTVHTPVAYTESTLL